MKNSLFFAVGAILIFLSNPTLSQSNFEKSFSNISQLEIDVQHLDITYQGFPSQKDIYIESDLPDETAENNLIFITVGNILKISYQGSPGIWSKKKLHVSGPENIQLHIHNASGSILVDQVQSNHTQLSTHSGHIKVNNLIGNLDLAGNSGKIEASNVDGNVKGHLTSGVIEMENINGKTELKATSGKISATYIQGEIDVMITSGTVHLKEVSQLGHLKLNSGLINAEKVGLGPNTAFMGNSGAFKIRTFSDFIDYNFDLKAGSGIVKVGERSSSDQLWIENGSEFTIYGKIGSGIISVQN